MRVRALSPAGLLPLIATAALSAQSSRPVADIGISGDVLSPEGMAVTNGAVTLQAFPRNATAAIDAQGRFRLVPEAPGSYVLFVVVPGFAPLRVHVVVPGSRTMAIPPLQVWPATYFRARILSPAGEVVAAPVLRTQSIDAAGLQIPSPADYRPSTDANAEGDIAIGPLLPGKALLAVDTSPFAQTRLGDVNVSGQGGVIDGGTITLQPGAVLHVDLVDTSGAPVSSHDVALEDASQPSPIVIPPRRTNRDGRATFERLHSGRYRLRTRLPERCGGVNLTVGRVLSLPGRGAVQTQLVLGGTFTVQVNSPLGILSGASVSASPDTGPPPASAPRGPIGVVMAGLRMPSSAGASCTVRTDAEGRATFTNFPPGPASIEVRLAHSTFMARLTAPEHPGEIRMMVPNGLVPVRVTHAATRRPIAGASIVWTAGGTRSEARTTGTGDALLESVPSTGGTIQITADGFTPHRAALKEPPGEPYEAALTPVPPSNLQVRVVAAAGEPVANAAVSVMPGSPAYLGHIASTDARGEVNFDDLPPGSLRVMATADGFDLLLIDVPGSRRGELVVTLTPRR